MPHQPIPKITDEDLRRIARRDFGEESITEVLALLSRYQGPERPRVRVDILKLSACDFRRLPVNLDKAVMDYRDVIMEAEMPNYPYHEKDDAIAQPIIDEDWRRYREWLERKEPNQPATGQRP